MLARAKHSSLLQTFVTKISNIGSRNSVLAFQESPQQEFKTGSQLAEKVSTGVLKAGLEFLGLSFFLSFYLYEKALTQSHVSFILKL